MTTLNEQRMEAKSLFEGYKGIQDTFTEMNSTQSIINAQNSTMTALKKKYEFVGDDRNPRDGTVAGMKKKFIEAEKKILLESEAQLIRPVPAGTSPNPLAPYKNCLPYGVRNLTDVNTELYDINEKKWEDFHGRFKKIFTSIGKTQVQILEQNSSQNINTISAFLKSFSGSVSEWPDINPLSGGIGSCNTLYALFNKYYMEYQGGIEPENFYEELIGSLHTSHIHSIYKKTNTKFETPKNFGNTVNAYNFDTSMWFKLDEPTDEQKDLYKYNGFLDEQKDSYGQIFSCGGLPVRFSDYLSFNASAKLHENTNGRTITVGEYGQINELSDTYDQANRAGKNVEVGSYKRLYTAPDYDNFLSTKNIVVVSGVNVEDTTIGPIDKKFCMLYRKELKKGDAVNEQTDIDDPKQYLFNSKSKCVSPFALQGPDSLRWCQDDILYSQRHRGAFVLLFIRFIFDRLYPIQNYTVGYQVNIYARNNGNAICNNGGVVDITVIANWNNLATCKSLIKTEFNTYASAFNKFDSDGFKTLMKFIDDAQNATAPPETGLRHAENMETAFSLFQDNGVVVHDDIHNTLTTLLGNVSLVATNALLTDGDGLDDHYKAYPVLMYRFLMSRMVRYYRTGDATTNKNFLPNRSLDNLYQPTDATAFTTAKFIGNCDNLTTVIQTMTPTAITQLGGTKSKTIKKSLPAIGGKKPKLRKQKGGTSDQIFQNDATPANTYPKLFANRVEEPFNPKQFKEAVKKFVSEKLDSDHTKVKALFDKFAHIDNLPLFYDGYDDTLTISSTDNRGGTNTARPAGQSETVSFTEIAQLFLYNSVITNSTRLLIHFFSNIKACLEHFIKIELIPIIDKVKTSESQHEKVKINLEKLVEEVGKLINFLKYNGINLQDRTPVFDNGQAQNFKIPKNSYYIKNLFLGSGTFVGLTSGNNENHIQNYFCQQQTMFTFLNKLLFINKYGNLDYMMFSNALKFLTDRNQPDAEFVGLNAIYGVVQAVITAHATNRSDYIKDYGQYIQPRPTVCFGGVPVVFFDRKNISLLMRSFFFLLEFRIDVGNKLKTNYLIKEELAFSELEPAKRKEIFDDIKKTIPVSYLKTLAINLGNKNEKYAIIKYTAIFTYIYKHLNKLIIRIDKKHAEYVKSQRNVNPNKKKSILNYNGNGGEPKPFSLYGIRASNNIKMNEVKQAIDFIKEKYQVEAEFNYLIEKLTEYIRIELKNNIRDSNIKNIAFYYVDTHIRNFKIYLDTYLLTLSDSNIPQETKDKLRQYVGFKPAMVNNKMNLDAMKETFNKLLTNTLINPQYTDPIWWAKIENNFMKIIQKDISNTSKVYRLFIITTRMGLSRMRDLYLVDAFALASSNDSRSYEDLTGTTGYRTHGKIKTYKVSNGTKEVYDSSNTIIKLTGVNKDFQLNSVQGRMSRKEIWNKLTRKHVPRTENERKNESMKEAIQVDIQKLIDGEYLYYDSITMSYKKLIPIFLQADNAVELSRILTYQRQRDIIFGEYKTKINDELTSYTLYNLQDKQIKDIKEYRKWLYQIMFEEQMKLDLTTNKQKTIYDTNIKTNMTKIFKGIFLKTTSDFTGKCARVLNIYDYAITKSPVNTTAPPPQPLLAEPIQREEMKYTIDMGAIKFGRFISRDDLIKLLLAY